MKKKFSNPQNKKKAKNLKKKSVPFHYDDKGRRIFDFPKSEIQLKKKEQIQSREENLTKNLCSSQFKCEKCDLVFTDNLAYKDHLNGKKHNMKIGNDMIVKQSTVESIREKLLAKKREREIKKQN